MLCILLRRIIFARLTTGLFFLFFSLYLFSQQRVKGFVYSKADGNPIAYASVINDRGAGIMTDTSGMFSFLLNRRIRLKDSVQISAIGYQKIRVSIADVLGKKHFWLEQISKELENVIVVSTLSGNPQRFGYYRSWNEKGTGGEIGQIIQLPQKNLRLGAVQVKINQNYDTCWLKLHVRAVGGMFPEEELQKEELVIPTSVKYGLLEFDLGSKNIRLPSDLIYVGFEVMSCNSPKSDIPSFFFMGSEEGENIYRDSPGSQWDISDRYTIYIRLLLK